MKALFILLLPLAMFSQSKTGWMFINENTIDLDKQMHFTGSAFLSGTTYMITYDLTNQNRKKSKIITIATMLALTTTKELLDDKFSWGDMAYNTAGIFVATYTFDFIVHRAKRREQKRQQIIAIIDDFYENNSKTSTN